METSENFREKTPEIKNEWLYLAIPAVAIAFAEMQMYLGKEIQSIEIHAVILLGLLHIYNVHKEQGYPENLPGTYSSADHANNKPFNTGFL